jgi:hypothetical protein
LKSISGGAAIMEDGVEKFPAHRFAPALFAGVGPQTNLTDIPTPSSPFQLSLYDLHIYKVTA